MPKKDLKNEKILSRKICTQQEDLNSSLKSIPQEFIILKIFLIHFSSCNIGQQENDHNLKQMKLFSSILKVPHKLYSLNLNSIYIHKNKICALKKKKRKGIYIYDKIF